MTKDQDVNIKKINIQVLYGKILALLDEKEGGEYIVSHQTARNVLIEVLSDMEKMLKK